MNLTDMKEGLQVSMLINYFGKKIMIKPKIRILYFIVYFAIIWVISALSFQSYMLYLYFSDQNQKIKFIINKIESVIDKIR